MILFVSCYTDEEIWRRFAIWFTLPSPLARKIAVVLVAAFVCLDDILVRLGTSYKFDETNYFNLKMLSRFASNAALLYHKQTRIRIEL